MTLKHRASVPPLSMCRAARLAGFMTASLLPAIEAHAGNSGGGGSGSGGGGGENRIIRRAGVLGIEFVWVGAPGNRGDKPDGHNRRFGKVDYGYWFSATEITNTHYTMFLNAVATNGDPHNLWRPANTQRHPEDIVRRVNTDGTYRYEIVNNQDDHPVVRMDHRSMFRFMNWLHNGATNDPVTTEYGAYDASQWGHSEDGRYTDSMDHEAGARYWLPSENEWYKAAYFDPDRYGENQPGYWDYPTRHTEEPDVWYGEGANPFNSAIYAISFSQPVGTIPTTFSPWGVYDMAGNASEYIADWWEEGFRYGEAYVTRGDYWPGRGHNDIRFRRTYIGAPFGDQTDWDWTGFRIVTTIPAPGAGMLVIALFCVQQRRRKG